MEGNFKGFAMLRQMTLNQPDKMLPGWDPVSKPQPVYIQVRHENLAALLVCCTGCVLHPCQKRFKVVGRLA